MFQCLGRSETLLKKFWYTIRGRTVGHDDTTDESPVLSGYTSVHSGSLQWRIADNDPCSASETL